MRGPVFIMAFLLGLMLRTPAEAASDHAILEEVVVRAQLRKQTLEEVPLSITVLDSAFRKQFRMERIESMVVATPGLSGSAAQRLGTGRQHTDLCYPRNQL